MKKILSIASIMLALALNSHAQGLVSIRVTAHAYFASTNSMFGVSGPIQGGTTGGYCFELLTSPNTSLPSTDNQIVDFLSDGPNLSALSVWTDTGVSGSSFNNTNNFANRVFAGQISAAGSVAANNWAAPSGATYDNQQSYIIIGWSANYGTTYSAFLNSLDAGLTSGYFGSTAVDINVAGGGSDALNAVNMWGNQTGTPGYGNSAGLVLNEIVVPEPGTIAMAASGGLSLLAFRRKK